MIALPPAAKSEKEIRDELRSFLLGITIADYTGNIYINMVQSLFVSIVHYNVMLDVKSDTFSNLL